jgi:hypothetical protein
MSSTIILISYTVLPPQEIFELGIGTIGITFDLSTHAMVDHLPDGWEFLSTCKHMGQSLNNHDVRLTVITSPYISPHQDTLDAKGVCVRAGVGIPPALLNQLGSLEPHVGFAFHKAPTCLTVIKLFVVPEHAIITEEIRLGGAFYPGLLAPAPAGLVPEGVPFAIMDDAPDPLPLTVHASVTSLDPANWAHPE